MSISIVFAVYLVGGMVLGLTWRVAVLIPAVGLVLLSCSIAPPANPPFSLVLTLGFAVATLQVGYLAGAALAEYLPPWRSRPYAAGRDPASSIPGGGCSWG